MGQKAAIFCHNGLGDGVISLVLANNLQLNGWHVDTYHNSMGALQQWFPHLPVIPYPPLCEIERILGHYDWFFIFHNDSSEFVHRLTQEGKLRFPDQVKVIYAYPSPRIVNEPYYQDAQIDPTIPLSENLRFFCEKILSLPKKTRSNGFIPPPGLQHRLYPQRIAIHPTGSRTGKNWDKEKFVALAQDLHRQGYTPVWTVGAMERSAWLKTKNDDFEVPEFPTLDHLARFIYESGYLIGNDSGLGHLASFLDIPTLTIARRKTYTRFSAPSYATNVVVTPSRWIPNVRWFRLRDRHWQKFISPQKVLKAFGRLVDSK